MRSRLPFRSALTLLSSPVALLATGCVTRPWTPAVPLANWSETPQVTNYEMPAQGDALRRWRIPPGQSMGPLREVHAPHVRRRVAHARGAARRQRDGGGRPRARRGPPHRRAGDARGHDVGRRPARRRLRRLRGHPLADGRGARAPRPHLQQLARDRRLIPAEETLAALTTMTPRPPEEVEGGARPVFLLDAWRLAYRFEEPADDTYDNRYILTSSDLPDVETLRRNGIRRIVYLVSSLDDVAVEEDDVHATFLEWERSGIPIAMVDVSAMEGLVADAWTRSGRTTPSSWSRASPSSKSRASTSAPAAASAASMPGRAPSTPRRLVDGPRRLRRLARGGRVGPSRERQDAKGERGGARGRVRLDAALPGPSFAASRLLCAASGPFFGASGSFLGRSRTILDSSRSFFAASGPSFGASRPSCGRSGASMRRRRTVKRPEEGRHAVASRPSCAG